MSSGLFFLCSSSICNPGEATLNENVPECGHFLKATRKPSSTVWPGARLR